MPLKEEDMCPRCISMGGNNITITILQWIRDGVVKESESE